MHQLDEPTGGKAIFEDQKQLVECMCQCRIFNTPGSARDSEAGEGRPHRMRETLGDTPLCSLQQEAEGKFDYDFASLVGNRKRNFLFRTTLAEISAN